MITNDVLIDIAEEISDTSPISTFFSKHKWAGMLVGAASKHHFFLIFDGNIPREDLDEGRYQEWELDDTWQRAETYTMSQVTTPVIDDMYSMIMKQWETMEDITGAYISDIYPDCTVEFQRNATTLSPGASLYDKEYDTGCSLSFSVYDSNGNIIPIQDLGLTEIIDYNR